MSKWNKTLLANNGVPRSIVLGTGSYLVISSAVNALVYIKFNWQPGDGEVSSTNFDLCFPALGTIQFATAPPSPPAFLNARVVGLSSGHIAFWGW